MKVRFKKLDERAVAPIKAHATDAGFDLTAIQSYEFKPGERKLIDTGIAMDIPIGYCGLVTGRSGNTIKRGLVGQLGIIDSGYHDAIKIMAFNLSEQIIEINAGERIGQIVIVPHLPCDFEDSKDFIVNNRGGGFGSTGK